MNYPEQLRFTKDQAWMRLENKEACVEINNLAHGKSDVFCTCGIRVASILVQTND